MVIPWATYYKRMHDSIRCSLNTRVTDYNLELKSVNFDVTPVICYVGQLQGKVFGFLKRREFFATNNIQMH